MSGWCSSLIDAIEMYCLHHYPAQALNYRMMRMDHIRNITNTEYHVNLLRHYGLRPINDESDSDISSDAETVSDSEEAL